MEKLKLLPGILFSCYSVKLLILGSNFSDACILGILGVVVLFLYSKQESEQIQALSKRVESLETQQSEARRLQDSIQTSVASLKMAQGMRKVGQ